MTNLMNDKASVVLLLVALFLIVSLFLILMASTGGLNIAEASTLRYCVSSGSVCTGV